MNPNRRSLQVLIEQCGITLTPRQYDQLWAYHGMLRAANADLNLTRIHNFENMVLKHYVDSLLVLQFEDLPSPLMDMGSGPGLPGVPLKIARPDVEMILAEPRGARAEFLEGVCQELGLKGTEVYAGKIGPKFTRPVAGVITRAVASIPETLDRVAGCLRPGGRMLFMKGPDCDVEVREAASSRSFRLAADHPYDIPGTPHQRRLVVYERLEGDHSTDMTEHKKEAPTFRGPIREVSSEVNPTLKLCRELLTGRGIRKQGRALISGARFVSEVLERHPESAESWLTGSKGPPPPETASGLTWIRLADPLFREIDVSGTHSPILMIRVPEMPTWSDEPEWPSGCTLFVPFQDPENVGAVIRSAAAFSAARVVLLREAAHPFHPRSVRASGPALLEVPLLHGPSVQELASTRHPLIALAMDGDELEGSPFPETFGLVPGLEGPGLPEHLREGERRRIPIASGVESLNAATAAAVALYAWRRSTPRGE
ncbi:MAG: 16S rRNA (guanine(527)-N(7))-methyltransferase RsmG [Isosphaeraceae bacterium]